MNKNIYKDELFQKEISLSKNYKQDLKYHFMELKESTMDFENAENYVDEKFSKKFWFLLLGNVAATQTPSIQPKSQTTNFT